MVLAALAGSLGLTYLGPKAFKRAFAPPQPEIDGTPSDLGLPEEQVWLRSRNGTRLHAWYIPVDTVVGTPTPGIVVLHGWGANSSLMLPLASHLHKAGFHSLFLDARNHGLSEHDDFASMPRFAEDLDVGVQWLAKREEVSSVGVIGHSVGAAASILSASRSGHLSAVVAVSSFAHPGEMMHQQLDRIPRPLVTLILAGVQRIIGYRFEEFAPQFRIGLVEAPVLLVHGDDDDVVPLSDLYELSAADPTAEVLIVPGGGHRDLGPYEPYVGVINDFFRASFAAAVPS